jgi:hypothetical protein
MTCGEFEILLCDWLDGTLSADREAAAAAHAASCAACGELARDARAAQVFLAKAEPVAEPPFLAARILAATQAAGPAVQPRRSWWQRLLHPSLEPRVVMGMALTVLSFSMMAKCAGVNPRQLGPEDLEPAQVWGAFDDRLHRGWHRAVKFYENLKIVYEVQTQFRQLTEQMEEEERQRSASRPLDDRRLTPAEAEPKEDEP